MSESEKEEFFKKQWKALKKLSTFKKAKKLGKKQTIVSIYGKEFLLVGESE